MSNQQKNNDIQLSNAQTVEQMAGTHQIYPSSFWEKRKEQKTFYDSFYFVSVQCKRDNVKFCCVKS